MRMNRIHHEQYILKLLRTAHHYVILFYLSQQQLHKAPLRLVAAHPQYRLKVGHTINMQLQLVVAAAVMVRMHIVVRCHQRRRCLMTTPVPRKRIIPVRIPVPIRIPYNTIIIGIRIPCVRHSIPIIIVRVRHIIITHLVQPHILRLAYVKMYIRIGQ